MEQHGHRQGDLPGDAHQQGARHEAQVVGPHEAGGARQRDGETGSEHDHRGVGEGHHPVHGEEGDLHGEGDHRVRLDEVIIAMREVGEDMHLKYKETSIGGLATSVATPAC